MTDRTSEFFRTPVRYVFWWCVAISIVVLSVCLYFTEAKNFQEVIRLLNVSMAAGVVVAYFSETIRRALKPQLASSDLLLLGITIGWFGQVLTSGWVLLWRMAGQPSWMINSDVINVCVSVQVAGCALHLIAPGAIGGAVPRRNMAWLGVLVAVSIGAALLFLTETDVIQPALKKLQPYFETPNSNYDATRLERVPEYIPFARWKT